MFRVVLSHSRKGYSEVVWRQTTENFIACLENAIHYLGGAPKRLVIDNLKAAVAKADWYDPELHPKLQSLAQHYGTVILPTKPYKPEHKGKVESGVKYAKNNALKGRTFESLTSQNEFLLNWEQTTADNRIADSAFTIYRADHHCHVIPNVGYLPLIWIAHTATRKFQSLTQELKNLYKGEAAQPTLWISGIVILTFTLKFFGMIALLEMQDWWSTTIVAEFWSKWTADTEAGRLMNRLVVPDRIPVWHIASFVNAVMAFGLAAFAERYFQYGWNLRGRDVYRLLRTAGVIRVCLSCYTIGCSLYITLSTVEAFKLPRIGEWLPFS